MIKPNNPEPFGYFRAMPFGWEDCAATDDGAQALYDEGAIRTQAARIAELEAEVERLRKPLTDEQVAAITLQSVYRGNVDAPHMGAWIHIIGIPFARAIEAAKEGK